MTDTHTDRQAYSRVRITQGNTVLTTHRMTPGRVAHKDTQVGVLRNCGWMIHKIIQVDTKWVILWIHRVYYMWEVGVGCWVGGIYSNNWGHGDSEEPMWGHIHNYTCAPRFALEVKGINGCAPIWPTYNCVSQYVITFTISSVAMIMFPINQDF